MGESCPLVMFTIKCGQGIIQGPTALPGEGFYDNKQPLKLVILHCLAKRIC